MTRGICRGTVGAKNANPAAYSASTVLFYVPMIRLCMDYEPFRISYAEGEPYTGADTAVYPEPGETHMGAIIARDAWAPGSSGRIRSPSPSPCLLWDPSRAI